MFTYCVHASDEYQRTLLPEPLTLADALNNISVESHPDIMLSKANQLSASADLERAESQYGLDAAIDVSAGLIEPSVLATDQSRDDNSVKLNIKKQLYDFGYTAAAVDSAKSSIVASDYKLTHIKRMREIEITQNYYNAILSDLKYLWDNEDMSMMYTRLDKSRDRYALKQISQIELLGDESTYQKSLTRRRNTEFLQRTTRALLAESINRPGELSSKLDDKIFLKQDLVLKEPEEYIATAIKKNASLLERKNILSSINHSVLSSQNRWRPTIDAEVVVSEYSRDLVSRESWRAGLNLHVPLIENSANTSEVSRKRAELLEHQAQLKQAESDVRKRIYTLWQKIQTLQVEEKQLNVEIEHARRALDKSRGEYELELRTNFGIALVNTTRVSYLTYKNKVDQMMAWMEMAMLTGDDPVSILDINGRQL